jgi:exopolyphosphatase/guanosine-5'-triphosphate,3'-diphosphate pyrophosphatase
VKVAALDLGSNTSLLLIAEVESGVITKVYHDETRITKLGQGVHAARKFHPDALRRMEDCLGDYGKTIKDHKCEKVAAVATSAARDVSNGGLLMEIGRKNGIPIHIISGAKEAALTFKGALCDRKSTDGIAVIDVGGGSTEIIAQEAGGEPKGTSVDVGSVRLTEMFIREHPVHADERWKLMHYVHAAFQKAPLPETEFNEVVAVAGTPTTLAAVDQSRDFDEKFVHGYKLSLAAIDQWTDKMAAMTVEERESLKGMQPKRADVIVAGSIILSQAIRALGKKEVTVSTRGVRYGVALAWQEF